MTKGNFGTGSRALLETTFVLFFLSVDFGQNLGSFGLDTALLGITVVAVAFLPFYLPSADTTNGTTWVTGRSAITLFGVVCGIGFGQLVGGLVPEVLRLTPLVLATVAGVVACMVMLSGVLRLNYAD